MKYVKIDSSFINLVSFQDDLSYLFIEVNEKGLIKREVGFNVNGDIIHAYPSKKYQYGKHGIFDLNLLEYGELNNDLTEEDFERIWNKI